MIELRDYQKKAITSLFEYLYANPGKNPCLVCPTGCHEKGQGILMANGEIKKVENIAVGEYVMGGDGTPRKVLSLHHGFDQMYSINPIKGKPFVVNAGHILSLISTNEGKKRKGHKTGNEIDNISVSDYLKKSNNYKHLHKLYRGKVENFGNDKELPIPSYVLGVLLGDGSFTSNNLSVTTPDTEIYQEIISFAKSIDCIIRMDCNSSGCPSLHFRKRNGNFVPKEASYNQVLMNLGLKDCVSSTKFIPFDYKTASKDDRLDLLAGLMDTDGSLSKNGYDFITKSKQLANDTAFIARSLGLRCFVTPCKKYCQNGTGGTYYRLNIAGNTDLIPCRVKRKQASARRQKKRVEVTGFSIESVGEGEYFGFECDGDHLYMLDDFTVTHNSGKSVLLAEFCRYSLTTWPETRILVLTHQKELVLQDAKALKALWNDSDIGIYSASIGCKQLEQPLIYASIQSIYKVSNVHFDVILIDEAHLVNNEQQGMYRKFIEKIRPSFVIGLTATPYRLGQGMITDGDAIFNDIIDVVSIKDLQRQGYLALLRSKSTAVHYDLSKVRTRGGEYIESELQEATRDFGTNEAVCDEIVKSARFYRRKHILIFCTGIEHAETISNLLNERGMESLFVTGSMSQAEREKRLDAFTSGHVQALTNVSLVTTGFDYPDIDMIVLLRATLSTGLYMQMLGRGLRLKSDENKDCLVLDFAENVMRHGPITEVVPPSARNKSEKLGAMPCKECPECLEIVTLQTEVCPSCGFVFPKNKRIWQLYEGDVNGGGYTACTVQSWYITRATSRSNAIPMFIIEYRVHEATHSKRDFILYAHEGYAYRKTLKLIKSFCNHYEINMEDFYTGKSDEVTGKRLYDWDALMEEIGYHEPPRMIVVERKGKFDSIVDRLWKEDLDEIKEETERLKEMANATRNTIMHI